LRLRLAVLLVFPADLRVLAIFLLSLQLGSKNHQETARKQLAEQLAEQPKLEVLVVLLAVWLAVWLAVLLAVFFPGELFFFFQEKLEKTASKTTKIRGFSCFRSFFFLN
jgi:uncharacterized membrane protein YciS (DUF1049 family)